MMPDPKDTKPKTCKHQPEEDTKGYFSWKRGVLIIDVKCRACGDSGSFFVRPDDINWSKQ
jgi:hypothetical protein